MAWTWGCDSAAAVLSSKTRSERQMKQSIRVNWRRNQRTERDIVLREVKEYRQQHAVERRQQRRRRDRKDGPVHQRNKRMKWAKEQRQGQWDGGREVREHRKRRRRRKGGGLSVTPSCLSPWLRIENLSRGCPLLLVLLGLSLHFWWDNTPT